ncbi:putative Ig domain-containing protein [Mesorhizobium sp. 1B3]|uniref:putative Ig domain-containing protein n=1 Tax=Mesorhizobium sp. 1B3 TaxID=3243599 RepID=UPI003D952F9A
MILAASAQTAPEIASISPIRGAGYGDTMVTITGTGFTGTTGVTFGGMAATSVTVVNDSTITAWTPAHPEGTVDVVVTTPAGSATADNAFTYWATPVPELSIDDVSMAEGDSGRKSFIFTVRLSRSALFAVSFDVATSSGSASIGSDYDPISQSGLTIPVGSSSRTVYVSVIGDTVLEPNETFFVNVTNVSGATVVKGQGVGTIIDDDDAPPTIASIAPNRGPTTGGTFVTINGTGFTSTTSVAFGGTDAASFRIRTPTRIEAETPANAAGAVDVAVTTGSGKATLTGGFTFEPPPPVIQTHPRNSTVLAGENAAFSVTAANASSYRWQVLTDAGFADIVDGGVYSGARTPTLAVTGATQAMNGYMYRAVVTGPGGEARSNSATLTVVAPLTLAPAEGTILAKGRVGTAYNETSISASGGIGSIGYSATGLPDGLSINADTGAISGTPMAAGIISFTVRATASHVGGQVSSGYVIEIEPAPPLVLNPPDGQTLTQGRIHSIYTYNFISASGGVGDIAFSATGLPAGLEIDGAAGVIHGKPTERGTFTVTVTAKAAVVGSASADYTLTITDMPVVPSPVFEDVEYGSAANEIELMMSGGTPISVAVVDAPGHGTATAVGTSITYTPNAGYAGPDAFTYTATNEAGTSLPAVVSINVRPPSLSMTPAAGPLTLDYGVASSQTLSASGGAEPYAYALTSGTLPAGLRLDAASGTLSGTPSQVGNFPVTITATDSSHGSAAPFSTSASYTLQVNPATIAITPASLPAGTTGTAYNETLSATGGIKPYTFSLSTGLPPGLNLRGVVLSGVPTESGRYDFAVWVQDANGQVGARTYSLVIDAPALVLTPANGATLTAGQVGEAYNETAIAASGGAGAITFAATGLPAGLSMDASSGAITGTPAALGTFSVVVTATGATSGSTSASYTLVITAPAVVLTPVDGATLAAGEVGSAYNETGISASGGEGAITFAANGLPAGLAIDSGTGAITGTPAADGTLTVVVTATAATAGTASASYTMVITAAPVVFTIPDGSALTSGMVGVAYSDTSVSASGGSGAISYTAIGLPAGLSMDSATGAITGTPAADGIFTVAVTATAATSGSASANYTLAVAAPIVLTPADRTTLPAGEAGAAYSQIFTASGGSGSYTFAVTSGALPAGLTLSADGSLSGTPTAVETASFTITASDAGAPGNSGKAAYTLEIEPAPLSTNAELASLLPGSGILEPGFNAGTLAYVVSVGNEVETITVTPTAADTKASITVNGQTVTSGTASQPITLAVGLNPVQTVVTAQDGTTIRTYTVSVTRATIVRPDPSLDPEVVGVINAQANTAARFAQNQMRNFHSRLEQLHNEGDRRASSIDVRLGITQNDRTSAAEREIDQLVADNHSAVSAPPGAAMPGMLAYGADGAHTPDGARAEEGRASPFIGPDLGPFAAWSGGFINFGERDSGGLDLDHTMIGVSGGIDYRFSEQFVGGFGIGYGRDRTDVGENGTESRASAISAALYGSYKPIDNLFIDGLLGGSRLDFDSTRFVTANGEFATGNRSGKQIFGSLTAAYEFRDETWLISPYGTVEVSHSRLGGFAETGGGIHGLTYSDQTVATLSGILGIRANYASRTDWGVLTPGVRAEYTHDFAGSSRASLGYTDLGGLPYAIEVDPEARDFMTLGLSLDMRFENDWNLGFDYRTAFGTNGDSQDHTFGAKFGVRF